MTTQTQTKYTLGPWHARGPSQPDNTGGRDRCVLDDDGKIIAECFEHVGFSDDRKTYAVRPAEANARLIAAAPELLDVVVAYRLHHKLMLQIADDVDCPCQICKLAEEAIRKAKGEL